MLSRDIVACLALLTAPCVAWGGSFLDIFGFTLTRHGTIFIARSTNPSYCLAVDTRNAELLEEGRAYSLGEVFALKRGLTDEEWALCFGEPRPVPELTVAPNTRAADLSRPLTDEAGRTIGRIAAGAPCEPEPVEGVAATPRWWATNADGERGLTICH